MVERRKSTKQSRRPKGSDAKRPNILVLLVDELRVPPLYEMDRRLVKWRRTNLKAQERLRDCGMEFLRHYTGATACSPSRTTIQTGLYPSVHGVTQVDGAAKAASDPGMFWLDPNTAPTIGNYFRTQTGGYQTHYRGKWHVSRADILLPGSQNVLNSFNNKTGARDPKIEALYRTAERLDPFGYSGWVGPEPQGANPHDSGNSAKIYLKRNPNALAGRDIVYAQQTVSLLEALHNQPKTAKPWLIFCSFVNPHDIALYGAITTKTKYKHLFDFSVKKKVPLIPRPPDDDLQTKPRAQASYRMAYQVALQPTFDSEHYRRLYYQRQWDVDCNMQLVLDALDSYNFAEDTIVIFTSDHGELLGSHSGLFQKWHVAYDEAIRVPLIVHSRQLFKRRETVDWPTSHVDLLPTLLGLAKIDAKKARQELQATHCEAQALVGRDLSPLLHGRRHQPRADEPVFFMTDDQPTVGLNENNFLGMDVVEVAQPHHILTVVATIETKHGPRLFKYSRYFDNSQFAVVDYSNVPDGYEVPPAIAVARAVPDEFEMYNLDDDPNELRNLAHDPLAENQDILKTMDRILKKQCELKRRPPQSGKPAYYEDTEEIWHPKLTWAVAKKTSRKLPGRRGNLAP